MTTLSVRTSDATAPYTPLATGGQDVAAAAEATLVAANTGRVKVTVCHAGGTGTLWLGLGQTATANSGLYLLPGDVFEEFTAVAIHVRNSGSDTARVTWVEWGA